MVQALVSRVVGTPIRLGHGTEADQYRALTEGAVSNAACGQLTAEDVRRRGGHIGTGGLPPALPQQFTQKGGRGGIPLRRTVVTSTLTAECAWRHGAAGMAQGAEILHGQGVVGALQKGGGSIVQQGCGGSLTTGGEGQARLRRGGKVIGKGGAVQAVGQTPQGGQIPTLAAEQEGIGPGKGQQPHAAAGEGLRRGHGPGRGELQHQVSAAADRHLGARRFGQGGEAAPLGEGAAHGADHRVRAQGAGVGEKAGVSPVEGVKFADDTDDHDVLLSFFIILQGKWGKCNLTFCRRGIYNGENGKSEGLLYADWIAVRHEGRD